MKIIDSFTGEFKFLNNAFPCNVEYQAMDCKSAEHAYQMAKMIDADSLDRNLHMDIADADTITKARRLGRSKPVSSGWDQLRLNVMEQILESKFENFELGIQLMLTGDAQLVQGMENDLFWGQNSAGLGENQMGLLLMKVRDKLKAKYGTPFEFFQKSLVIDTGKIYGLFLAHLKNAIEQSLNGNNELLKTISPSVITDPDQEADQIFLDLNRI